MIEISKRERFYQQEYCGCVYSYETAINGVKKQATKIEIGKLCYTPD